MQAVNAVYLKENQTTKNLQKNLLQKSLGDFQSSGLFRKVNFTNGFESLCSCSCKSVQRLEKFIPVFYFICTFGELE